MKRFARLKTHLQSLTTLAASAAVILSASTSPIRAQESAVCLSAVDVPAALEWIKLLQNEDGGFSNGFAPESDPGGTADAVAAIIAGGGDPAADYTNDAGNDPLAYLTEQSTSENVTGNLGLIGKLNSALQSAEPIAVDPAVLEATTDNYSKALYVLYAVNADDPEIVDQLVGQLLEAQNENGGWAYDNAFSEPDTNSTALVIQALIAAESDSEAVARGLEFLRTQQNEDGGFPYQVENEFGSESDANSTALVIQALRAAGEDLAEWNNPQDFLSTLQMDNGAFMYQQSDPYENFLATVGAIPALCGYAVEGEAATEATPEATAGN